GGGAQAGTLVKNAAALERAEKMNVLVVDKTGTLTVGVPSVVSVQPSDGLTTNELLRFAMSLEAGATHPLARAIVKRAADLRLEPLPLSNVRVYARRGVAGRNA